MADATDLKSVVERHVGSSPTKDIPMLSEEDRIRHTIALLNFSRTFTDYVKECDPKLYARARQFAIDNYERVEGIEIDITEKKA